ncbi:type VI secretion system-associated FHA domain protein TagH [Psychromonas antarctica]|jgi:type VI secretion system protein ImpI|uniref:type VI secretion system-associated FHA domain protein TagH n=1 Tax=Psychromonas antarctica TaxID=67573 RepID=UPI001EE95C3C|nr:type VI secretion system-associated FHA domain protein TagH [Psychromonas antarctica]MCG6201234.1 type VI secretion system-associated FHA domain protein TagH [Psychromonas antarctica]
MQVDFKIVSYHRLSPEQVSTFSVERNATFGRSNNNDWCLPDPEKVVSGTHVKIVKEPDGFYLYDLSTNGVFINRSVEALGADKKHKLFTEDLLAIGDYEVSVKLSADESNDLANADTFTTPVAETHKLSGVESTSENFFAEDLIKPRSKAVLPVINNDLNDHYSVPISIPEEWDLNLLVDNDISAHATESAAAYHETIPQVSNQKVAVSDMTVNEQESVAPVCAQLITKKKTPEIPVTNAGVECTGSAIEEFLKGLGISDSITMASSLPNEIYFELGQSMNLMLTGLMTSLRHRAALKSEFKINQTTFQQQENNPLKFSATIDDVFQNLYLRNSSSFLSSKNAIQAAFNDTENHDKALAAGTLGALQGVLAQFDPEKIKESNYQGNYLDKIIPKNTQARNWNLFVQLHENLKDEISIQGSSALTDDFVKAYDQTIKSLLERKC